MRPPVPTHAVFALLVSLAGVDDPEAFLADPFPRFALASDDTLSLPMLSAAPGEISDETTDEQSRAAVKGVPAAECSVD